MTPFLDRLDAAAVQSCGLRRGERLAVAASGGVDSTVLLRALALASWPVIAIHIHHGLRPSADEDAAFVRRVGEEVGVEVEVVPVAVAGGNVQAAAREARYAALAEAAGRHGCAAVATAHTATDQAETVLMNLVRGTGLRGLAGMAPRRSLGAGVDLVRPLLWATRAEVEAEARARGWAWREDPTNATSRYRRNRIRAHVLPLLEAEGGPETTTRIARAADAARAALSGPAPLALLEVHGRDSVDGGRVAVDAVREYPRQTRLALWAEALRRWAPDAPRSSDVVERVDRLLEAPVGQRVEAGGTSVWREREALAFIPAAAPGAAVTVDARGDWTAVTASGTLATRALDRVPDSFAVSPLEETVDADRVPPALTVRPWRDGDRIRPLGLDGTKRVSDLLTDARVPPSERRLVPVVAAGERVLWVVGHRLAADVAVTAETRRAARWTWTPVAAPESGR